MPFRGYIFLRIASWPMMLVWLLLYGSFVGFRKPSLNEQFITAASSHDFERQKDLLYRGADIDFQDEDDNHNSALMKIVAYNLHPMFHDEVDQGVALAELRFLLERGANPNLTAKDGQTALTIAAVNNEQQAIKLLKEYGASR